MAPITVSQTAVVSGDPEQVYTVLSDYIQHHPNILPRKYFKSCTVEEGGKGAGTLIDVRMAFMGVKQAYLLRVTEPTPGTLVETDVTTGLKTSFIVKPASNGKSHVEIATTWEPKPGLRGWFERLSTPPVMRSIYAQELNNLDTYVQNLS